MGYSVSWLAVNGKTFELVIAELGLSPTGEREEIPESPIVGASLPTGWVLIFYNEREAPFVSGETLQKLSKKCRLIECHVEEHTMFSMSGCYENGDLVWNVMHESRQGIYHLEIEGSPPEAARVLADDARKQQEATGGESAGVDYVFDVPILLAQNITSFRHDLDIDGAEQHPFHVLTSGTTSGSGLNRKKWWRWRH
ncbi:MAG TPA: hypothetical protein VEZ90_12305 [Blastocatellia bacterium]|nr:hypothetical protein [Blastocatellia bacterium]